MIKPLETTTTSNYTVDNTTQFPSVDTTQTTQYTTATSPIVTTATENAINTSLASVNETTQETQYTTSIFQTTHTGITQETEYATKNLTLTPRPVLKGLTVDCDPVFPVKVESIVKANVTFGLNVTFKFQITLASSTVACNQTIINSLSAMASFTPLSLGRYTLRVTVTSSCLEKLEKNVSFAVISPIEPSVIDLSYEPSDHRSSTGVFYPKDLVGIALKVVNTATYSSDRPSTPNCTMDWGDGTPEIQTYDVDLRPDTKTLYIYTKNYIYTEVGKYTASVMCENPISKVQGQVTFQIVSPAIHSSVEVLRNPEPYPVDGNAVGSIKIIQNCLKGDYPDLLITIDFGPGESNESFTFSENKTLVEHTFVRRGNYRINVTFDSFNMSHSSVVSLRIGVLVDFYQEKHRSMVRINEQTKFKLVRYLWDSTLIVDIDMDPELSNATMPPDVSVVDINVTYSGVGMKRVTASTEVYNITEEIYCDFETYVPCISTIDLFESTYRDPTTPLKAWLTTLPKISGRSERTSACDESDQFNITWQVWKNTWELPPNLTLSHQDLVKNYTWIKEDITQPKAIVMDFVYIKSSGLYKLELNISVIGKREKESDEMYLEVGPPPLVVKIDKGIYRQVIIGKELLLDAISVSYDPPLSPADSELSFSWSCYKLSHPESITRYALPYYHNDLSYRQLPTCNAIITPSEGKMTISTTAFRVNELILFEAIITKDSRFEIATQTVELLDSDIIEVFIKCIWNCDRKLSTEDRTVYEAEINKCSRCTFRDVYEAHYKWSVYKYDPQGFSLQEIPDTYWGTKITSNQNSSRFDTEGGWWEEATTYLIVLNIKVSNYAESKAMHVVYTNVKPYGGTCTVKPSSGKALETIFSFKCTDWKDEEMRPTKSQLDTNFGLQYSVYQTTSAGFQLVYFGSEIEASTLLSECPNSALTCGVVVNIIDIFRTRVNYTLNVQITPKYNQPTISSSSASESVDDITFDMMKKMNSSISVRDSLKIAKRAATLTSSLSSMTKSVSQDQVTTTTTVSPLNNPVDSSFSETATNLVDIVGVIIDNYHARSPEEIQMMANSMSVLTNDTKLMTTDSMETASNAVQTLSSKIQNMDSKLPDLNHCMEEITDVIHNIVEFQSIDINKLFSDIKLKALEQGLSDLEAQSFIESETMKFELQIYEKSGQIDSIASNITSSWDQLLTVLPKMEDPTGKFNKTKPSYLMKTQKTTIADVKNSTEYSPPLGFTFDGLDVGEENLSPMVVKAVKTKNIFIQGQNSKFINADIIIGSVDDSDGNKLNLSSPKVIHETEESNCSMSEALETINPQFIDGDASQMFYHQFEYTQAHLFFCLKLRPFNPLLAYTLYLRMDIEPTDIVYDKKKQLTINMFQPCEEICFPPNTFSRVGTVYVGLKPSLNETALRLSTNIQKRSDSYNLNDAYLFGVTTSACFSWNDTIKDWQTDKCKLTKEKGNVVCTCGDGKEIISAVSFNFEPNTIHFGTVFSKFDIKAQGIVFGVLITLYVMFTLTGFWAHYMDKKGMLQWGVFPLVDNYCHDTYFYLITVHTGLRRSAGTKSNVYFCLSGQDNESGIRKLSDGIKEGFPSGSVCHFVMACEECLGDLQCIKIWHDNSGKGNEATWYLDQIDIVDLQTAKSYFFVCGEWLSPEYSLETSIAASCVDELETLKNLFFSNTKKHLTDDHIWLSVFIRPQNSRFSRVERSLCCLAFLFLAMITSAMFYTGVPDASRKQPKVDFEIGPLRLGYQQMYNSFLSALITAIPMLIIMMIFRKARTKSDPPVAGCLGKNKVTESKQSHIEEISGNKNKETNVKKKCCQCSLPWMVKLEKQLEAMDKILLIKSSSEDLKGTWPQPFRYFAWVLVVLTVLVCSFFVILYSMEWGQDVTKEWLTTFILAFLQSLFVLDPFKVLVISVILALLVKKVKQRSLHELDLSLISEVNKEYGLKENRDISSNLMVQSAPLSHSVLKMATLRRKIYVMIKNTLTEFLIHAIYLLIVSSLCYTNHSTDAYHLYKVINDQLITDTTAGFMNIKSSGEYFEWLTESLTPWLLPELNRNLDESNKDKHLYTEVNDIYLMGAARMRQLRIQKVNCSLLDKKLKICIPSYNSGVEETDSFCLGWKPKPCSKLETFKMLSSKAWTYKSPQEIWGLPIDGSYSAYSGGGYVSNLLINAKLTWALIKELKEQAWIDQQTRAVFLEFTVYCPNINHFAVVILLAEFTEIGGIVPFVNVYPFTVHNPSGHLGTYVQLCQITGIVLTILGVMYVVFIVGKKKLSAFKDIWFLLDMTAVILALCAVIMFLLRLSYTKSALKKMSENRRNYINFYQIVVWDSVYTLCLAFLVAIGYMRMSKLASYSDRTMKVFSVLSNAVKIFPSFFFFNVIVLFGFIATGCALFGRTSYYFKDLWTTAETLFTGLLGRSSFRDTNLPYSDQWMTILYFCLFVFIVVIFLTNYFIAILMDLLVSDERTRQNMESTKIFIVLWDSFLNLFGRRRDPTDRLQDLIQDDMLEDEEKSTDIQDIMVKFQRKFQRLINGLTTDINPYLRTKENFSALNESLTRGIFK
ncbi:polycystin family receptor for egg jelly-like [Biomphalaria glabrata]|uniref:Polycystin family receptor for egg jelly-like n=2 Tax=Biomphalaria glabrata TaxID=6526 RepID=A0A9W2ZQ97_BIOGL|nr:polycystin family receptor for egg jelly-like [Biomphalaria glabrata]